MKYLAIALTAAVVFSSIATAAPTTVDVTRPSLSASIQEVVLVDDALLSTATGGLNRAACFGVTFGITLAALGAGAVTGGVGLALLGAYMPIVGTVACSL